MKRTLKLSIPVSDSKIYLEVLIMIGAIIGDIVGSRFEFHNHRSKDFELFAADCFVTDDSIMTLAAAKAIMEAEKEEKSPFMPFENNEDHARTLEEKTIQYMQEIGQEYPDCGYGGRFHDWIFSYNPKPYNSYGNGAAMRISPAGLAGRTEREVMYLSRIITGVSHNHPEGYKGADATALCIFLARMGYTKPEIIKRIEREYYKLDFTIDEIRDTYKFNETCQDTVPQAILAFLESTSFEDAIRTAISVGGDSDTLAAITGSIAEAYYGVPSWIRKSVLTYLDKKLLGIYTEWQEFMGVEAEVNTYHVLTKYIPKLADLFTYDDLDEFSPEPQADLFIPPIDQPDFDLKEFADYFTEEFLQFLESRLDYQLNTSDSLSLQKMVPWEHDSMKYIKCEKLNPEQILSVLFDAVKAYKEDGSYLMERIRDGSLLKLLLCLRNTVTETEEKVIEEIHFQSGGFTGYDVAKMKFSSQTAELTLVPWQNEPVTITYSSEMTRRFLEDFTELQTENWKNHYTISGLNSETHWTLAIKYENQREVVREGDSAYPPMWTALLDLFGMEHVLDEEDLEDSY